MTDPIEDELTQALQGDEEAIRRVAARLRGAPGQQEVDPERAKFLDAVTRFRDEYRDVCGNEQDYAAVVKLDASLAKEFPDLSYEDRLGIAGRAVRSGSYRHEPVGIEADRVLTIAEMRRGRAGYRASEPPVGVNDNDSQAINRRAFASGAQAQVHREQE